MPPVPLDPPYDDTIWHFTVTTSPSRRSSDGVRLQVFHKESELFEALGSSGAPPLQTNISPQRSDQNANEPRRAKRLPLDLSRGTQEGSSLFYSLPPLAQAALTELPFPAGHIRRIKVSTGATALDDLPWELLTDGAGTPFCLRDELRVVRSVPVRIKPPALTVRPPIKVLLVLTNPKDERLLNPFAEVEAIAPRLRQPPFQLELLEEPTLQALTDRLQQYSPHILHYVGHSGVSSGEGNLILHNSGGGSEWLCASDVARLLPIHTRLLCLSTCFTAPNYDPSGLPRFANAPASVGLPTTVVNRFGVSSSGASVQAFWAAFYEAFAQTLGDVNEAIHVGRKAARASESNVADWASFSLVVRDESGAGLRIGTADTDYEQLGAQIRAQFASKFANQVADEVLQLGSDADEQLKSELTKEINSVTSFVREIKA
jgi:hypothetical protein